MNDDLDLDLERLRDIPDPFPVPDRETRSAPVPPAVRGPTRTQLRARRWIALGAVVVYELGVLAMAGFRRDLETSARLPLLVGLVVPLVAAALALWAANGARISERLSPARVAVLGASIASAVVIAALLTLGLQGPSEPPWRATAMCIAGTSMMAMGPMALALLAFRNAFAVAGPWRTAALGVASGAVATAAISLRCAEGGVAHNLLGHGVVLALAAVAGLLASRVTTT